MESELEVALGEAQEEGLGFEAAQGCAACDLVAAESGEAYRIRGVVGNGGLQVQEGAGLGDGDGGREARDGEGVGAVSEAARERVRGGGGGEAAGETRVHYYYR